jgi:hypothetical protein
VGTSRKEPIEVVDANWLIFVDKVGANQWGTRIKEEAGRRGIAGKILVLGVSVSLLRMTCLYSNANGHMVGTGHDRVGCHFRRRYNSVTYSYLLTAPPYIISHDSKSFLVDFPAECFPFFSTIYWEEKFTTGYYINIKPVRQARRRTKEERKRNPLKQVCPDCLRQLQVGRSFTRSPDHRPLLRPPCYRTSKATTANWNSTQQHNSSYDCVRHTGSMGLERVTKMSHITEEGELYDRRRLLLWSALQPAGKNILYARRYDGFNMNHCHHWVTEILPSSCCF